MKKTFYSELVYVFAQLTLTLGGALLARAGYGVSMVVAPAYLISEKVSFLTFGMAAYSFQALLLVVFCIVMRGFRVKYLISFLTAFIYGNLLDLWLWALSFFGEPLSLATKIVFMILGILFTALGVSLFFKSYIPPEVYDMFVQGVSEKYGFRTDRVKWIYDLISLAVSIGISFLFFSELRGIGVATFISAIVNGPLISVFSKLLDRLFNFRPAFRVPRWLA